MFSNGYISSKVARRTAFGDMWSTSNNTYKGYTITYLAIRTREFLKVWLVCKSYGSRDSGTLNYVDTS